MYVKVSWSQPKSQDEDNRKVCALLLFQIVKDKILKLFVILAFTITARAQSVSSIDIGELPKVNLTKDSLKVLHIGNSFGSSDITSDATVGSEYKRRVK